MLPLQQQPAGRSAQPSHPTALPATQLAAGQLWLSKGQQAKRDMALSTQLVAIPFVTNSDLQCSLAPATHSRLKFIFPHTLTEVWSVKFLLKHHSSGLSPSLLLQDLLPLCSPQPLAAVHSEDLSSSLRATGTSTAPIHPLPGQSSLPLTPPPPQPCPLLPSTHSFTQQWVTGASGEELWCCSTKAWLLTGICIMHRNFKQTLSWFMDDLSFPD